MGKASKHPYEGKIVYFGTKHGKEAALGPLLSKIGCEVRVAAIDTDRFGTFTGEVEREGSVRDTLRAKIAAVFESFPEARLALASEGSFGPHLWAGLAQSNHEALLFADRDSGREIYVERLMTETNHDEMLFRPGMDLDAFCARVRFPSHALIIRSRDGSWIRKGIADAKALHQAILDGMIESNSRELVLSTDMRAHFNPTRMEAIGQCGERLLDFLMASCPRCEVIGFGINKSYSGLPCELCGKPTANIAQLARKCTACGHETTEPRPDGKSWSDPAECARCNP